MIDHFYRCSDVPMMFLVCLDQPNALKLTEHNYSKHPNKRFGCFVRVSNFGCSRTLNSKLAENTKIGFDIYKIIVFLPKFGRFSISALCIFSCIFRTFCSYIRLECSQVPISGSLLCEQQGRCGFNSNPYYLFIFQN